MTTRLHFAHRHPRISAAARSGSRYGLAVVATVGAAFAGIQCGNASSNNERVVGQSTFSSVAPQGNGYAPGATGAGGGAAGATADTASTASPRTVEETDLYRLEGDRLYYLNSYRGLMVFDVSNVDHPTLLGRSALFGTPIEMIVRNGIATVVVSDWYGTNDDGTPFHGSIVRGIDATNPANMRILGDAKLGGYVSDTRVVGDVLYAVSQEYSWGAYSYGVGVSSSGASSSASSTTYTDKIVVSSVSFAGAQITAKGRFESPGWSGVFNVTPSSILFAHAIDPADSTGPCGYAVQTRTALDYIDISDPGGNIVSRGHAEIDGVVQGWGADRGRWNIDFADGKTAHALGQVQVGSCYYQSQGYLLSTVDFSNPDAPVFVSSLGIPSSSWTPAARFDGTRLYLTPTDPNYYGSYFGAGAGGAAGVVPGTPIQIYDLSTPASPKLAGSTSIEGSVWNFIPSGNRLFALGNDTYNPNTGYGSAISLRYVDVTDAANPQVIGTSKFGENWAWTPAAGTFKAFTKSGDSSGLVVLPFSGWSSNDSTYNNGLQLIEFTPTTLRTAGAAKTHGWVERGIFVKNRLVSLSDRALSVVDYSVIDAPTVVTELTLARNVISAKPSVDTIAELSSDWFENDADHSDLRVIPIGQAEENVGDPAVASVPIAGVTPQAFHNGELSYIVSEVRDVVDCSTTPGQQYTKPDGSLAPCYAWHQEVQVVDRSGGSATKRGKVALPISGWYWYPGWGWEGCYAYNWWWGNGVVQVADDALALQLWSPRYGVNGDYVDAQQSLFVVDLSDPDAPSVAFTRIIADPTAWWGNMRAVGNKLYTTHYEWERSPSQSGTVYDPGVVRYYLDQIDLTDRKHPIIGSKINVPGILVGASETDPSVLYTIDYRWSGNQSLNDFDVVKIVGDKAILQSIVEIPGWVGATYFANNHAYMSVEHYAQPDYTGPQVQLYQLNLRDPQRPTAQISTKDGWGWLLGIEGDRALVTSGWGSDGVDIYRLSDDAAPSFDQFVRTRGWWASSLARQGNQIFLASGYWGVQTIELGN
jgi:hypothetical protein